jgi:NitT/TauT family transport system permease protein
MTGRSTLVEAQRRRTRRRVVLINVARLLCLAGSLALWELFSGPPGDRWTLIDEFYLSEPSAVAAALRDFVDGGVLWSNVLITFQETAVGFLVGALAGVAVGFAVGVNKFLASVLTPFVTALYSVPRLAIAPLFILWFGLGIESKIFFVATIVFFLVFYNTYSGVRDVDRELIDVLRIIKPGRLHIYRRVTLPSAMTWILTGLRVSAPYALVGAVTSEMISSNRGMGYLLIRASGQLDTAGVFAAIVVMMVMALMITAVVLVLERYFLRWKA